jgi:defect-in-organelle-trafficking protein DotB
MMTQNFLFANEPARFNIDVINEVLLHCIKLGASDVTLQSNEIVYAEIYGNLQRITHRRLSNTEVGDILNSIYGANGTTQLLSGTDLDTHYEIKPTRGERYRFRINATACLVEGFDGIQITARVIPSDPPTIAEMELPQEILAAITPDKGVIYVTGATGSGKSTLLAAIIRKIAEEPESNRKILTYESPIEFVYDSINKPSCIVSQAEIPRHLPSFAAGVRNALRRKPRLILVGEARDQETIGAVIEASMTGHPVYTTLHSNSVAETVRRLVNTFPSEERDAATLNIIDTIRLVISQRLVPTVDGKRVALREYLVFNEEIRDQLINSNFNRITATVRDKVKEFGKTILTDAKEKFAANRITERQFKLIAEQYNKEDAAIQN